MEPLLVLLFVSCLATSFILSGLEAGLFRLSRWRIRHLMRSGNKRAALLHGYLEHPENFLWTILIGNSLANLVVFSLLVFWGYQRLGRWPLLLILSLAGAVLVFYAIFELLPKTIFRTFPNRLCMFVAVPFRLLFIVLRPLVAILAAIAGNFPRGSGEARIFGHLFSSREEMRWLLQEWAPGLTPEERAMVNRVLDLRQLSIGQIAIPIQKAVTVRIDTSIAEVLQLARERNVTRLPVWKNEHIAGLVSLRQLLYEPAIEESRTAGDHVKAAIFLESEMRLETALRQMQRVGQHLAIVVGPDRKPVGIVSLQDILKAIFGDVSM